LVRTTLKFRLLAATFATCACAVTLFVGIAQAAAKPVGAYTTKNTWSFVSAPKLHPPKLITLSPTQYSKLVPGYFMVDVFKNLGLNEPMAGEGGPLILNSKLQPVWYDPIGTNQFSGNLHAQTYLGKPVLTWWQGLVTGLGVTTSGEDEVVNQHYQHVATLKGADGWIISEHEMIISGPNAWVTAYKNVPANLTPYGGSANGTVLDSAVQEYDLATGQLLYTWDALNPGGTPNVPLSQSKTKPAGKSPWDAYHINSIQLTGNGTFLVSLRNTWSAYLVDRSTNAIDWTLSGNPALSSFKLPKDAQFQWQHDVELHSGNVVSVFDDACCNLVAGANGKTKVGPRSGPTRGLIIKLNLTKHTGSFVAQYTRGSNFNAAFLGNIEPLSNGNVELGWGSQPFFSEDSKSGKVLLDAVWPAPDQSYRAYVQKWVGIPSFPPSGAVQTSGGKATVYASWDGDTQVTGWRVLAGTSTSSLKTVATATKNGFETAIKLSSSYKAYEVQALNSKGHVLSTSKAFGVAQNGSSNNSGLPGEY
jgi:hypothetical protein